MIRVVSGFNPDGYELYGKNFLDSFIKHWPKSIELMIHTEEEVDLKRGVQRSLWDIPGVRGFVTVAEDDPIKSGKQPTDGWTQKDRNKGYSFRFDAAKFCRQCVIPLHASQGMEDGDVLVWLDADVLTFADVPEGFISSLTAGGDITFLGRGTYHSEIGFWAVRINTRTRIFLQYLSDAYLKNHVFELKEWHSAYVFDHVRKKLESRGLIPNDLTGGMKRGSHVWWASPLCQYMDHLKGAIRKESGTSVERIKK